VKPSVVVATCVCLGFALLAVAQTKPPASNALQKETRLAEHAKGTFEVKVIPQPPDDQDDPNLGRFLLDKQFHGDLEGTSKGQMLTAGTAVKGSGGYVAIEKISGTLRGRSGTFVLQHIGTMTQGTPEMSVTVVPDSGTGELVGISGRLKIIIADGKHSYEFAYSLP
jgi:uncharacterized protein DUF3224